MTALLSRTDRAGFGWPAGAPFIGGIAEWRGSARGQGVFEWFRDAAGLGAGEPEALSDRETEVLGLLARGLAAKEAAAELGISPKTVDNHRQNLMRKLGLRGRAELVLFAVRAGIVTP